MIINGINNDNDIKITHENFIAFPIDIDDNKCKTFETNVCKFALVI